ncbi:zinc finger protein 467 [Candoia aspera]|uniref:zinc finger protein 467 n=1 Tax=Candoia aspera TaxID=51853 RepID=UPI002FD8624A
MMQGCPLQPFTSQGGGRELCPRGGGLSTKANPGRAGRSSSEGSRYPAQQRKATHRRKKPQPGSPNAPLPAGPWPGSASPSPSAGTAPCPFLARFSGGGGPGLLPAAGREGHPAGCLATRAGLDLSVSRFPAGCPPPAAAHGLPPQGPGGSRAGGPQPQTWEGRGFGSASAGASDDEIARWPRRAVDAPSGPRPGPPRGHPGLRGALSGRSGLAGCRAPPPRPAPARRLLGAVVPASLRGGASGRSDRAARGAPSQAALPASEARRGGAGQAGGGAPGPRTRSCPAAARPGAWLPAPPRPAPPAVGQAGAPLPRPRMVPVRCEDAALYLVPEHWRGWAVRENTMRENYGAAIALGSPVTKPEIIPQEGGLLPAKGQDAGDLQQPPDAGAEQAVKGEQQLQAAAARPDGPVEPKDPARSCPGEWLIRTVKVEAEDYSEWPAGLSTEALLSGLPLASACKSEGRILGPECQDGGSLGELSGLALQQWQMLSQDKPLGCPRCERPAAPLGGSLGDPRPRPFACLQCGKAFGKKAHLTRHARVHTGERPFACTHCGRRFSQKIHLGSHERVHTGERPFPCDRCPKSFRKKTHLVRHQLTHTGERPHACSLCARSFVHRRHLLRHQRLHEEEGAAPPGDHFEQGQATPPCENGLELGQVMGLSGGFPQSGEVLATSALLGQACRVQGHRGQAAIPYGAGMELGKSPASCAGHMEPDQGPLLFKAEPGLGGAPGTDRALERDDRPLGEALPEPGGCGALCGAEAAEGTPCLEQVGKAESEEVAGAGQQPEEKPFLCSDCGKAFAWRKNLASHQRLHAEGGRPFSCAECGRGFSDKRHLTAHLRGHMGLLPYACPHCERSFAHRAGLAAHQCGGHTGQRPFACSECGRCFAHKRHLQRHWRNQHSAERPYSCAQCGRTFSTRASLLAHIKSHAGQRPFACPLCGRAFSRKSHLARHEAVHTGLRPHACTQCPRRFSSKTNLVRHQAVHTGLRPYICTHCARSFSRKTHLLRHERTHTSTPLPSTTGWVTALPQSSLLLPPEQRPPLLLPMALESPWP